MELLVLRLDFMVLALIIHECIYRRMSNRQQQIVSAALEELILVWVLFKLSTLHKAASLL
ncbi:unnamed protein product, partial [Sphenostylis stenocarpa]